MISVIIPCYNCETSLETCVDSVLKQTYSDLEILLIDDGSQDTTDQIGQKLAESEDRITYFRKENGGPGSARNYGIEHAAGEYLLFVDSDDYLEPDMVETLYKLIKGQEQVVMAACRFLNVREGEQKKITQQNVQSFVVSAKEALAMFFSARQFGFGPVCKLIRAKAVGKKRFPEIYVGEDAVFIADLLLDAEQVAFTTAQKYYCVNHASSLRGSAFSDKDYESIAVWDQLTQKVLKKYPDLVPATRIRYNYARFYVLDKLMMIEKPDWSDTNRMEKIIRDLKKYPGVVYTGPFTRGRKIAFFLLNLNPAIYRWIIRRRNR